MEKSLKTILLVDDDSVFLKGMMYTVRQLGYDVLIATGGKEAADIFSNGTVDAIISDINMPEGNGLQLLNFVKKRASTPVILMTGLSDLQEAQKAIDMGATSFLSKPFKKTELGAILQNIFEFSKAENESKKEVMLKLHVEEFLHGQTMNFDIFLKKEEQFIKVSNGGEKISPETIVTYRQSGITSLYVKKSDLIQYLELKEYCSEIDKHIERKIKVKEEVFKVISEMNHLAELNPQAISRALSLYDNLLDLLMDNEKSLNLIEMMIKDTHGVLRRGVHSSLLVVLVSQYSGAKTLRESFILATSSLFADTGLLGSKILPKMNQPKTFTEEEKAIFDSHPARGVKILSQIQHLPIDVLTIVKQHEDKTNAAEIHPLSKIVCAVNAFITDFSSKNLGEIKVSVLHLEDFAIKSIHTHDIKTLEAMLHAFNLDTPQEFVEYQLNHMLGVEEVI